MLGIGKELTLKDKSMILNNEQKKEIVKRLVKGLQPEKIILFGSQAWGNPGTHSDVDIMVIVPQSLLSPAQRAQKAYSLLHGLGFPKDIMVKTRAEFDKYKEVFASLESKVNRKGIILYG